MGKTQKADPKWARRVLTTAVEAFTAFGKATCPHEITMYVTSRQFHYLKRACRKSEFRNRLEIHPIMKYRAMNREPGTLRLVAIRLK